MSLSFTTMLQIAIRLPKPLLAHGTFHHNWRASGILE
jgi:hypothetical protein